MVICETKGNNILHARNGKKDGWAKKKNQNKMTLCGITGIIDTDLLIDGVFKKTNIGKVCEFACIRCRELILRGEKIMNVGDAVRINKCDRCPSLVGKNAVIKALTNKDGRSIVELRFGRGRPPVNRPTMFDATDVSVVQ